MSEPDTAGNGRTRKERTIKIAVGLAIVVAAAAGLLKPLLLDSGPGASEPFDAAAWRQSVPASAPRTCDTGLRVSMVDDLIANHLPPGLTTREVVALLGRPLEIETTGATSRYQWLTSQDELRTCMGLAVTFEDGKLSSANDVNP